MRAKRQARPEPLAEEIQAGLLEFLRRKFYAEDGVAFCKDRERLLKWVVLWPAAWFRQRGVTVHGDAYREIFFKVMLQADAHRSERIRYRPAWLKMVLQSHFRLHGEDYYEEAKSMRAVTEKLLLLAGRETHAPDPVGELAIAHRILMTKKPQKKAVQATIKEQLNLFG